MEKIVLHVEGMSCEHCVKAITNALNQLHGISGVAVDLASKTVAAEYDQAICTIDKIRSEIEEQGYEIAE